MNEPAHQDAMLRALSHAAAYPAGAGATGPVERIDTHISHVFLLPERVYKLRRPVRMAFLDFSSIDERNADCMREIALNRRLAPDVYLGVAPVARFGATREIRIGETREALSQDAGVLEHCVVMRRLRAGRDMKSLLAAGAIEARHIDSVAARMAAFHARMSLGKPAPFDATTWVEQTTAPARANIAALLESDDPRGTPGWIARGDVEAVAAAGERFAREHAGDFRQRLARGRIVDGHGDLHCEHVWFETAEPAPIMVDCLEFRDDFRRIDAASDIAFLAMDLRYRGRPDLSARLLRRYARDSADWHLFSVVDYFLSYRAMVRAKVAALVAGDASLARSQRAAAEESAARHLELGASYLRGRAAGKVVLVSGTIGSGKTTVAEALADHLEAVVVSSDHVRKARAGMAATQRSTDALDQGMYESKARDAVYAAMLEEAQAALASQRTVILDATFARRGWREKAARWAASKGSHSWLIEVTASQEVVLARLEQRKRSDADASDAGPELYRALNTEREKDAEWPAGSRARMDTGAENWRENVRELAERVKRS